MSLVDDELDYPLLLRSGYFRLDFTAPCSFMLASYHGIAAINALALCR